MSLSIVLGGVWQIRLTAGGMPPRHARVTWQWQCSYQGVTY